MKILITLIKQLISNRNLATDENFRQIWIDAFNDIYVIFFYLHQGNNNKSNLYGYKQLIEEWRNYDILDAVKYSRPYFNLEHLLLEVEEFCKVLLHEIQWNILVKCELTSRFRRELYEDKDYEKYYKYKVGE